MPTDNLNEYLWHYHNDLLFKNEAEWTAVLPETEYNNLINEALLENILDKITKSNSYSNEELFVEDENAVIEDNEFNSLLEGVYG